MTTKWAFDIDGVITANPQAISWLTYHLSKNENNNKIYIITWRDGSDPKRKTQTIADLEHFGIIYDELIMAPKKFENIKKAANWKIKQIADLNISMWFDDEIKSYRRDLGLDLGKLLPKTKRVWI